MHVTKAISIGALLTLISTVAYAFQEEQGAPPSAKSTPVEQSAGQSAAKTELSTPSADKGEEQGTEVNIPGLGRLGVLPKMDFGLELLYGVSEQEPTTRTEDLKQDLDDLTVRGRIKHRF